MGNTPQEPKEPKEPKEPPKESPSSIFRPRSLRGRFAFWVAKRTSARISRKKARAWQEKDQHIALVPHHDGLEVLFSISGKTHQVVFDPKLLAKVARYLVWWWIFYSWCGLRVRWWNWSLNVLQDENLFRGDPRDQDKITEAQPQAGQGVSRRDQTRSTRARPHS